MTILEAYKTFQLKQQNKWYESKFKGRSSKFVVDDVQTLIALDIPLTLINTFDDYTEYNLPDDYLDYISNYCKASRGKCTDRRMRSRQILTPSREIILRDAFNNPSFDHSETVTTVSSDRLQVYKTDFTINEVFLTYYRYPKTVDIAGYTKLDQTASANVDPELVDEYVNEIIDWCVTEVDRIFKDPAAYQLSVDRLNRNQNN